MNSIQDYNPDQHENEEKYWELVKRIHKLEEKLDKMGKSNEDDEAEMEWDPDAVEGMTDKWIFDQITTMSECLSSLVAIGKNQVSLNEVIIENIKDLGRKFDKTTNAVLGCPPVINDRAAQNIKDMSKKLFNNLATPPKANPTKREPFGGLSLPHGPGWITGRHITSVDDIKETKNGYVFSDLAGPDDGLHTVGSSDPAKTKVDKKKLVDSATCRTVSPTTVYGGGARDFWIDIDKLHQIANLMTVQGYNWPTIRIDDLGVDLVFAKHDKTETIRLDALIGVSPK